MLWLAIGLAAWAWLAAVAAFWPGTPLGERLDAALAGPLIHGVPWSLREALSSLARPVLLYAVGALCLVLLLPALRRRRILAVLVAVLVPPVSLAVLVRLREGWLDLATASFPSGHAVAGYAVLVSLACLWPLPRWWARALWVLAALVVTVGNVTLHAHLPGDVIAAALVVTGVSGLLLGILAPRPVRDGREPGRGTMGPP